jgi:hypothetical protein
MAPFPFPSQSQAAGFFAGKSQPTGQSHLSTSAYITLGGLVMRHAHDLGTMYAQGYRSRSRLDQAVLSQVHRPVRLQPAVLRRACVRINPYDPIVCVSLQVNLIQIRIEEMVKVLGATSAMPDFSADIIDDPDYCRGRGAWMRFIADRTNDPIAKSMMLRMAMGYDAIAQRLMSVPTAPGNGRRSALTDANAEHLVDQGTH